MGYLVALVRRCAPAGLCPGPQIRIVSANPRLDGRGPPRPSALRVSSRGATTRFLTDTGVTRFVTDILGHSGRDGHSVVAGQPVGSRSAAAREGTLSAEGLGGPRPSSLVLALTIRIWGPGQSPAGAQRRTKATHDPALYREVHPVQSPAGAQRRTKATHDPALYRDVHPVQSPAG